MGMRILQAKPGARMLGFGAATLAVGALMIFSAFFQTSIVVSIRPSTTVILRCDAGAFHVERYYGDVWLNSTVACTPTFQTFRWWDFWWTHSPYSGDWDAIFPIWMLMAPVGILGLWLAILSRRKE